MDGPGYAHPLESLLLCASDAQAPEPRYVLPIEGGLLYVDPGLRRRASKWGNATCQRAVLDVFAHHLGHEALLAPAGFDRSWAHALAYWLAYLQQLTERERAQEERRREAARSWDRAQLDTALEWRNLHVAAHSAGCKGTPLTRPLPRRQQEIEARLQDALERLQDAELRERLQLFGYKEPQRAALHQVQADRRRARALLEQAEQERQLLQGQLLVLRGALLGEVIRFSKAARRVLPRDNAQRLLVQRWIR